MAFEEDLVEFTIKPASREDTELIFKIAGRASKVARAAGFKLDVLELAMDLTAAHKRRPLKLAELLEAPVSDFSHDVFGIRRHIIRPGGGLGDCFLPRYTRKD